MGTEKTTIPSVLRVSSNHNEFLKSQDYLDPGIKSCFPGYPESKRNSRRISKTSVTTQKIPRVIEFSDEHGFPVTYRIQHDDNPNDTCNDFHPIQCHEGNKKTVLRLHKDGENFALNSLSNELPSTTIQSATDCFRPGGTINQFRRLCLPSKQSLSSVEGSDSTYSSFDSLNTNEDDDVLVELLDNGDDSITHDDEGPLICEINTHADHHRL